ncbi:MAG TPA: hypothetical protein VJ227_03930 [Patescibacteria group bacterium]|nr:hypothetical protein [Patescibacteria group bacterium]
MNKLAQFDFGTFEGFGPLGKPGGEGVNLFTQIISSAIGLITVIAFIWFVFLFITGAISIMTAGGDKQKLESSRQKIVNAIVGVIVIIAAMSVISLIGTIFGIDILNLPKLFGQITGGGK